MCKKMLPEGSPRALRHACELHEPIGDGVVPSLYAAQLAWWLNFFPPERFLVLPSSGSRELKAAAEVLSIVRCMLRVDRFVVPVAGCAAVGPRVRLSALRMPCRCEDLQCINASCVCAPLQ